MTQQQKAALVAALVATGGYLVVKFADNTEVVVDPKLLDDCSYQPPGLKRPPCNTDGTYNLKDSQYLDAGCLAIVCPRWAAVARTGKSSTLATKAELEAKAAETAAAAKVQVDAPVDAPVEVTPLVEEKP